MLHPLDFGKRIGLVRPHSFESLSHVSEVPLKPESSTVAVAIAVAGVIDFYSDGGPSTLSLSSFRLRG